MTRRRRVCGAVVGALSVCAFVVACRPPADFSVVPEPVRGWSEDVGVSEAVTVTYVVDGDTVDVVTSAGWTTRVRVIGIDTPETKRPETPVQCWGPEATDFARSLLGGRQVGMVTDPSQDEVDDYGRLLRYLVLPDGRNYSIVAAEAGTARSYVHDQSNPPTAAADINDAENRAQAAGVGLWGPPCDGGE
ncbi:thermonuclease family protein [Rhodococcus sp. NBC_00294]|uniref:thermonuclease family protein n=1 Tax=Rhodococcus sp. NBC_00294 TaxID=2976004 RepID=UPI002E2CDE4E|nr:thermonuclease family protein [Rhodococcus sp. NBC_00294]